MTIPTHRCAVTPRRSAERGRWFAGSAGTPSIQGALSSDGSALCSPRARSKRNFHAYHFAAVPEPASRKRIGSVLARAAHMQKALCMSVRIPYA